MTLTADQMMIQTEAARFLAERAPRDAVRTVIEAGTGSDAALWSAMAGELGWCAMAIPEELGGIGLGVSELVLLLEQTGMRLAPVPLWSTTCLAAPLLVALGASDTLARIASGEIAATLALGDPGAVDGGLPSVMATKVADGYHLSGDVAAVIDAAAADLILIPAQLDGDVAVFAVERDAVALRDLPVMDATRPMAALSLDVTLSAEARLDQGGLAPQILAQVLDTARLGLAAEQIGAAAGVIALTQDYIAERVQFGRTIASFQAIKHRAALLQVGLAEARALLWGAAAGFETRPAPERSLEIAALKALADDLARKAASEAIQMHGGVAMTWEYDPHFYFKRAQASAVLLGQADAHLDRIAAALLDAEG